MLHNFTTGLPHWYDSTPGGYAALATFLAAFVFIGCVSTFARQSDAPSDWRWGAALAALLAVGRWPTWFITRELNPDESHFIAGATTLNLDPVFWRSVDGITAGPLDFYALLPVSWLSNGVSFFSARITAWLLLSTTLVLLHQAITLRFGRSVARVSTFSAATMEAFSMNRELLHYSSELVSLSLLALAVFCAVKQAANAKGTKWGYVGALALGSVPFAKLQAVPPALGMGLAWLAWTSIRLRNDSGRLRELSALVAGSLTPLLIVSVGLTTTGQWEHAILPYYFNNLAYVEGGRHSLKAVFVELWAHISAEGTLLGAWIFGAILCALGGLILSERRKDRGLILGAFALFALSLFGIVTPGRIFPHYCQLLLVPGVLMTGFGLGAATMAVQTKSRLAPLMLAAGLLVTSGPALLERATIDAPYIRHLSFFQQHPQSEVPSIIRHFALPGEPLAVWGWMNNYYSETGLSLAHRTPNSAGELLPGPLQDYYRNRYLQDIERNKPAIFVDAVAPENFYFRSPEERHDVAFPKLAAYIREAYTLVAEVRGVRIYVSNVRLNGANGND